MYKKLNESIICNLFFQIWYINFNNLNSLAIAPCPIKCLSFLICKLTSSMHLSFLPVSFINNSVRPGELPKSVKFIVFKWPNNINIKLPCIYLPVLPSKDPLPMHFISQPLTYILLIINPNTLPPTLDIIIFKVSNICVFLIYNVFSFALHFIVFIFAFISYAFFISVILPHPFFFSIKKIALIFTAIQTYQCTVTVWLLIYIYKNTCPFWKFPSYTVPSMSNFRPNPFYKSFDHWPS